ncbi:MAG: diguanylate cyclase (GGDEF)-like protein/PAS domain S-box-containing protein [Candidatus Endobugula sp.]|jgi:diguanylate cyclase (GGDEF)-like protein/PAS domain S-box-containing protein
MYQQFLNILFVEDSEDDVELTLSELARAGYEISACRVETADAMQQALDSRSWDIIVSDYKMPEFSAERSLDLYSTNNLDIPFIIISGVVEAEDVVYLLKQGAHDFLNKSALARLIPAVERELREAHTRTAQRQAEQKVRTLSLAVEQSPVSVLITDAEGIIEYVNPKFEYTSGYLAEEAIGKQLGFALMVGSADFSHTESQVLWSHIREHGRWGGELCSVHKDGILYWEYINISPLAESGKIIRYVAVQEDITARRTYEAQLRKQAHYDDLTGLPNRRLIMENIHHAIATSHHSRMPVALLCIDLDNFKNVNDTLGHEIGDELLTQAASRLAGLVSSTQLLGRTGGDEFFILMPDLDDTCFLRNLISDIMGVFSSPFVINKHPHFITASIGTAMYPHQSVDAATLLKNAELAMYQAKKMGRNQCQFFSESINTLLNEKMAIESALRGVEHRNELELFYQPIIDRRTQKIVSCEALLRWKTSDGSYIMPDVFIPVAEDTGLINSVGEWVIYQACKDLRFIHQTIDSTIKFAINISPKQLQESDFPQHVEDNLNKFSLSPDMLKLEITENVLIHDIGETNANLRLLCDKGFKLSIDDFGTGYSSLAYLQKYPFAVLKIDRSFVSQIDNNSNNAKLTEAIINMAHSLGMQVVAEGVETTQQQQFLTECECDFFQGYLFSRPIPLKELVIKIHDMNDDN